MRVAPRRAVAVEMSGDPAFLGRVRRLASVSALALGAIWALAVTSLDAHALLDLSLLVGWISMPTVLASSLRRAPVRRLAIVPSTLVTLGLVGICATALPASGPARAGWLLMTGGILFGGALGGWFWYRWFPVSASLDDPFSAGRWTLIAVHVAPIVAGLLLVTADALR